MISGDAGLAVDPSPLIASIPDSGCFWKRLGTFPLAEGGCLLRNSLFFQARLLVQLFRFLLVNNRKQKECKKSRPSNSFFEHGTTPIVDSGGFMCPCLSDDPGYAARWASAPVGAGKARFSVIVCFGIMVRILAPLSFPSFLFCALLPLAGEDVHALQFTISWPIYAVEIILTRYTYLTGPRNEAESRQPDYTLGLPRAPV